MCGYSGSVGAAYFRIGAYITINSDKEIYFSTYQASCKTPEFRLYDLLMDKTYVSRYSGFGPLNRSQSGVLVIWPNFACRLSLCGTSIGMTRL
jgi:hypothetical protein